MASTAPSRREVVDFGTILGVAGFLVAIHFLLPDSLHQALVFDHGRFQLYTLWTAAFVHAGNAHLFSNVMGFLLPTLYIYVLCLAVNEQRWFRRTFFLFLVMLPVLLSLSSYEIFVIQFPGLNPTSQGFSGVAAGFGGFLLVALSVYVRNRYSRELAKAVGISIFLFLMLLVDVIYAGKIRPIVAGLVGLGVVLQISAFFWEYGNNLGGTEQHRLLVDSAAVILVFAILIYIVVALFPANIVANGRTTNIFAHGIGFLLGIVIPLFTLKNTHG